MNIERRVSRTNNRKMLAYAGKTLLVLLALAGLGVGILRTLPLPASVLRAMEGEPSVRVLARGGEVLRETRGSDGHRERPFPALGENPYVVACLLAAEDRHFFHHPGVDILSVVRAAWDNARHRRIVSGASTLTMQLARTLAPVPHTPWGKVQQALLALRIEGQLPKERILELYLQRVPFGPSLRGIEAASWAYFQKPSSRLSLAEAATLTGLPRRPAGYEPHRHPKEALSRRQRVLARLRRDGTFPADALAAAEAEPLRVEPPSTSFRAPHFVDALLSGALGTPTGSWSSSSTPRASELRTTLDDVLQRRVEDALKVHVQGLGTGGVDGGAVLVVDHKSGEILSYVGSPDYFATPSGQFDGVRARRQPGSTLKPFVYGVAMERVQLTPASLLFDVETRFESPAGPFTPQNYDRRFHGPVRLREALGSSLNVPAVAVTRDLGVDLLLDHLRTLGFQTLDQPASVYGLGLALGNGEVRLLDLVRAYALLARQGRPVTLRAVTAFRDERGNVHQEEGAKEEGALLNESVALVLTDILADGSARISAFGAPPLDDSGTLAFKTGTSSGYRDNWALGFTNRHTVGVWLGRSDGAPMGGFTAARGALPLLERVVRLVQDQDGTTPLSLRPKAIPGWHKEEVCSLSGQRKGPACPHTLEEWVPEGDTDLSSCTFHRWASPSHGLAMGGLRDMGMPSPSGNETVVEEVFPEALLEWARATGRASGPLSHRPSSAAMSSPPNPLEPAGQSTAASSQGVRFRSPRDGARFVLDPHVPALVQQIPIRVEGEGPLLLTLDGQLHHRGRGPLSTFVVLTPGSHVLEAKREGSQEVHRVTYGVDGVGAQAMEPALRPPPSTQHRTPAKGWKIP